MPATSVLEGFKMFSNEYFRSCPHGHVVYLSITPFYQFGDIHNCMNNADLADRLVNYFCDILENRSNRTFENTVNTENMINGAVTDTCAQELSAFLLNPDYYLGHNHHLTDEGHRLLAQNLLLPVLRKILKKKREKNEKTM